MFTRFTFLSTRFKRRPVYLCELPKQIPALRGPMLRYFEYEVSLLVCARNATLQLIKTTNKIIPYSVPLLLIFSKYTIYSFLACFKACRFWG